MTVSLTHSTPADGTFSATGATAWDAEHVLTQATNALLGRATAGTGATEEISVGTGLSLSGGTLTNTVTATSPGGSTTQIQYNNAGAFAGASGITTTGTELALASGTKTASAPVLDMSQTWNNAAVTFTGLKLNVTDTTSAAASLLMDLQTGGVSRLNLGKAGAVTAPATGVSHIFGSSALGLTLNVSDCEFIARVSSNGAFHAGIYGLYLKSDLAFSWSSSSTNAKSGIDLYLTRRGAANLRLGASDAAAPVAQTLSVQSITGTNASAAPYPFTITGSQGTGTGAGGSIVFQVAPAGSMGSAQNALATALTLTSAGMLVQPKTNEANGGYRFDNGAGICSFNSGTAMLGLYAGAHLMFLSGSTIVSLGSAINFGWASSTNPGAGGQDLILARDAAGTLAQRNGTNAQAFRIYGTYTNASNYERGALNTGADYIELAAETAGTGDDDMDVRLTPAGTGNVRFGAHSAIAAETVTGYITIKDAGGTLRKIAVVS